MFYFILNFKKEYNKIEDAMLLVNIKKSKKDELEWLACRIKEVKQRKTVYLIAQSDDEIIGS